MAAVNAWVVGKWAGIEYTNRLDSIEWVYLALARHYREWGWQTFRGAAEWFPWWYNGVPVENTYPPLLPVLTAWVGAWCGLSGGMAYHWATAGLFILGPLGVYFVVWRWAGSIWSGLFAAILYSVVSLSALAMPSLAADMSSAWLNQRMHVLARYGEGPHLASIALLPWAWYLLAKCAEECRGARLAGAACLAALVVLSNLIGGMALAWAGLAVAVVYGRRAWWGLALAGLWAWAMVFRFVNFSFLEDIRRNAPLVGGVFAIGWAQYLGCVALAGSMFAIGWILRRRDRALVAALCFAVPMTAIPLAWEYGRFYFLPQPHRYHLEMEMAWAVALGLLAARAGRWLALPVVALLAWGCFAGRDYDQWIEPVTPASTFQVRATREMARIDPEARVYFLGGPRYFSGLERWQPQVGGGFANGMKFRGFAVGDYGTFAGRGNFLDTRDWLVAYGVDYVLVGGKESQDWIRAWADAGKFAGRMRQVWEEGDDRLYAVDRANASLAHVLPETVMLRRTPEAFYGNPDLQRYVGALEGGEDRGALWEWQGFSRARVRGTLEAGEAFATQVTYDRRWEAVVDGKRVETLADGLGQMWIRPGRTGDVDVSLRFRNPIWVWLPSVAALGAATLILLAELTRLWRRGRVFR